MHHFNPSDKLLLTLCSEQLAFMPNTFFIGDHFRMFPHLSERIIMADPERTANGGIVADNVAVINAVNPDPIREMANITEIKYEGEYCRGCC